MIRKFITIPALIIASLLATFFPACSIHTPKPPNIIIVFADDLGIGDIQCYFPQKSKIPTPSADQLAAEGMRFTDVHTSSSVCSPSRYSLLTGRYNWRTRLQHGVCLQFGGDPLIAAGRPTIASFLKESGYATALVGKWHLGYEIHPPKDFTGKIHPKKPMPLGTTIKEGPIDRGFDIFHGCPHAYGEPEEIKNRAVIENDRVVGHIDEINTTPFLQKQALAFVTDCVSKKKQPFFLYLSLVSPHTPIVPTEEWKGKSGLPTGTESLYGEFVMQTDGVLGALMKTLDKLNVTDNTLLIFTSDNGCSSIAGIRKLKLAGHYVSGIYRGSKADLWEGGHRVPFIARWPGIIKPGSVSDQTICMTDLFATIADIVGRPVPKNSAEDSESFLPAFSAKPITGTRKGIVHHSIDGYFAYRMGDWKLLLAKGSGGWSTPTERLIGKDDSYPEAQLYNLAKDPSESDNLYLSHPEVAQRLLDQMEKDVKNGRSTAGPEAQNDIIDIKLWKNDAAEK